MKLKVYYAHGMNLYNSAQEKRDHQTLKDLGFEIICPNTPKVKDAVEIWKHQHKGVKNANIMELFEQYIDEADCTAFRAHPSGMIPSGVAYEVRYAKEIGKPIFELPNILSNRMLSLEDTRAYLEYLGQR